MRNLLVILLVTSLGFHSFMKLGVVAWYEINKDYVANVLCENKDKPAMHCNGKCYLNKQLTKLDKAGDEQQEDTPRISKKVEVIEFLLTSAWRVSEQMLFEYAITHHTQYRSTKGRIPPCAVFHPPSV